MGRASARARRRARQAAAQQCERMIEASFSSMEAEQALADEPDDSLERSISPRMMEAAFGLPDSGPGKGAPGTVKALREAAAETRLREGRRGRRAQRKERAWMEGYLVESTPDDFFR